MKKPRTSQRAQELHRKFKTMRATWRALWVRYGRYAVEFDDDALYREYGYGSFKAYWASLKDALPYSTIAEAMHVIRAFPKMKDEQLVQYPKENLKLIAKLPRRRQLVYMQAAKEMKSNDLRAMINRRDNQHIEAKKKYVFMVEDSVAPVVEAALEKMIDDADDEIDRHKAFELIMARFVVGDSVAIVKTNITNARGRALNME